MYQEKRKHSKVSPNNDDDDDDDNKYLVSVDVTGLTFWIPSVISFFFLLRSLRPAAFVIRQFL